MSKRTLLKRSLAMSKRTFVEEVFVNVVASASVEEETGVKNLTSNNNTLIDPNKMKVKELKF